MPIIIQLNTLDSAVQGGADRLEVCGSLGSGGGITPSHGLVRALLKRFPETPLMVMIRPRCGDFVYSDDELEVMRLDIRHFKEIGVTGVVIGALTPDGKVDIERCKILANEADSLQGMFDICSLLKDVLDLTLESCLQIQVTFHRAFDMIQGDIHRAVLDIAQIPGINRILTSGQKPNVVDGLPNLVEVFGICPSNIVIMPGSGVSQGTIGKIIKTLAPLGFKEIHMSGGEWIPSRSTWRRQGMGMGCSEEREWDIWKSSKENISAVRMALDTFSE